MTLSKRQSELLDLIESSIVERGYPPTVRDLIAGTSITSESVVSHHLGKLADAGYIERDPGARAIRLLRGSDGVRRELRVMRMKDNGSENDSGQGEIEHDEI